MEPTDELPIIQGASAAAMASEIFGAGVTVVGASYSGDNRSSGTYSDGDAISATATPGDTGIILSTGRVRDFTNNNGQTNQSNSTSTNTNGVNNDADFNALAGGSTFDAAILDVDFIPDASVLTMQFVFASEEYPEFQNSIYQDAVGVWVNGAPVDLAIGNGDTDPGNINGNSNQNLYFDNTSDDFNTEMDGFTVTMTLTMTVTPGVVNSIRIGIADVSDSSYDSAILIAGGSLQTAVIAQADSGNVQLNGEVNIDVLDNDTGPSGSTLTVTHINGQLAIVGTPIPLATGETVTLNADGTLNFQNDADLGDVNFTYTITDGTNSDIGFVNVSSIPCFVSGTRILTPDGEVPVETLSPGDLVITRDDGPQPLSWVGGRTVRAAGDFAPILIREGTFGAHRNLLVSPQHRVLIRDVLAELLFGEAEVLVAAKDLVNDHSILQKSGGFVTYVHLMFSRHQVVFSEGLETESFLPGPQTQSLFDQAVVDEICALFPELDPETGEGYSPAARRILRHFEAQLLTFEHKWAA